MRVQELKGRRISCGYKQSQIATKIGTTCKTLSQKENSTQCKFSISQILIMTKLYNLSLNDVNNIFFDSKLSNENSNKV